MRFHILITPRFPIPPDQVPAIVDGVEAWHERWAEAIEELGMFPAGGAFAILDVADEASLHEIMLEMPATPFSHVEIRAFVDAATGFRQFRQVMVAIAQTA